MQFNIRSLFIALSFLFTACSTYISGTLPPPESKPGTRELRVGAAKTDITPVPGYPMGGFAIGGRMSRGVWTRLYARAVYVEAPDGTALVLVSCDLWSMPGGLADRVAELVATEYGVKHLAREQIILAATHTHHSPGNFSTSSFYNVFASPEPFFDLDLFDMLSHRIARTIVQASRNSEPARLFYGRKTVPAISRNRSFLAFMENGEAADRILAENRDIQVEETPFPVGDPRAYRAIDPMLTVLFAKAADDDERIIAAASFYAVHPTAMGPDTEVYSSDLFGVAAAMAEGELDAECGEDHSSVIALFNGAEGDVSSNWRRQDRPSTVALGRKLADGILSLVQGQGEEMEGRIELAFGQLNLRELARPFVGAPILPGSEGDWTFFFDAGWREGMRADQSKIPGHGTKMEPLAPEIAEGTAGISSFLMDHIAEVPESVRLGVYRIGDVAIATLPGEFTTALGRRISRGVADAAKVEKPAVLVGLANEYVSYFTTGAEHDLQHYEGASMIYGPSSATAVQEELVKLCGILSAPNRKEDIPYCYEPGVTAGFGFEESHILLHMDRLRAAYYTLDNVLMDEKTSIPMPDYPHLVWVDDNPELPCDPRSSARLTPSVSVEIHEKGHWKNYQIKGIPETDEGYHFVTSVIGTFGNESRWISYWLVPEDVDQNATLRLRVDGFRGRFISKTFHYKALVEKGGFLGVLMEPNQYIP